MVAQTVDAIDDNIHSQSLKVGNFNSRTDIPLIPLFILSILNRTFNRINNALPYEEAVLPVMCTYIVHIIDNSNNVNSNRIREDIKR